MKKFITLLFLLQGFCAIARSECDSVRIYFRQGHSVLEPGLHGNREALERIADSLRTYAGPAGRLRRIEVTGGASPEAPSCSTSVFRKNGRKRFSNICRARAGYPTRCSRSRSWDAIGAV